MAELQAVTLDRHRNKTWRKAPNYLFTRRDTVAVLGVHELSQAMMTLPIGFYSSAEGFMPVAVQGLGANENLFVSHSGQWLGGYIPAVYRGYPFRLAKSTTGEIVLGIDEASGLLADDGSGEQFFNFEGHLAKATSELFNFLIHVEKDRNLTRKACDILKQHELFEPWPIKVTGEGEPRTLTGLYRINEEKLNAVSGDVLMSLRDSGALPAAYCQLFSMQNLKTLGKLADAHANAIRSNAEAVGFSEDNGTISFDNLR